MKTGKRVNQMRHFEQRGQGEAAPARQPEAEVSRMLIATKQQKKSEEDNVGGRFEERDPEQSLVQYHVAPPPAVFAVTAVLFLPQDSNWTV
jgi:hypothetical protein